MNTYDILYLPFFVKAWEYMGAVMEREQSYKDAAEHYEQAWKHENHQSAQVGA